MEIKCIDVFKPLAKLMDEMYEQGTAIPDKQLGLYFRRAKLGELPEVLIARYKKNKSFYDIEIKRNPKANKKKLTAAKYKGYLQEREDYMPPDPTMTSGSRTDGRAATLATRKGQTRGESGFRKGVEYNPEECEYDADTIMAKPISEMKGLGPMIQKLISNSQVKFMGHLVEVTDSVLTSKGIDPKRYDNELKALGYSRYHIYDTVEEKEYVNSYSGAKGNTYVMPNIISMEYVSAHKPKPSDENIGHIVGAKAIKRIKVYYRCSVEEAKKKFNEGIRIKNGKPHNINTPKKKEK